MPDNMQDEKTAKSTKIIRNHIVWSMGAGLIPIPVADFFAVGAVQLDMVRQLCKLYSVDFKETEGKALISALAGSGLARLGASGAAKLIPGLGTIVGGVTMSVLSGASTYALGQVFKRHFETGGTFLDFDVDRLRKYYAEQFEKGKKIARDIQRQEAAKKKAAQEKGETPSSPEEAEIVQEENTPTPTSPSMDHTLDQLKKLAKLRDDGVISDEEFQQMKKKLVEEF